MSIRRSSLRLSIPEEDLEIFEKIMDLDEELKNSILEKFKAYKPTKFDEDIWDVEAFREFPEIIGLITTLFRAYHSSLENQNVEDVDDFTSQLINSFVKQSRPKKFDENKLEVLKEIFKEFLSLETHYFYFEKAVRLILERAKPVIKTRIITDIRPIFEDQKIDKPNYSLIIHNLRILYFSESRSNKKAYFALDHEDLIELKNQIDRALKKEEELQKICQKADLEVFEV